MVLERKFIQNPSSLPLSRPRELCGTRAALQIGRNEHHGQDL